MQKSKILACLLILAGLSGYSQNQNSSPYTRYGLGEIVSPLSTPYTGINASIALADYRHINFSNPATYANVKKHNPVFDVGFMGKSSLYKYDSISTSRTAISLRDFSLLLPVTPKTGFVFGLMPYSTTGYNVSSYDANEGDTITYNYQGMGSVNKLFFGLGQQVVNKGDSVRFSLGVNASYLFGTLQRDRSVIFLDDTYYNTRAQSKLVVRGFAFDLGAHYYEKVSEKLSYQLGVTTAIGRDVKAYQDLFSYTYKLNDAEQEVQKDTLKSIVDTEGYFYLPRKIAIGASVTLNNKWTISSQYELANWQNYYEWFDSVEVHYPELTQRSTFSIGAQYVPFTELSGKSANAFKLSTYRLGFNYGNAPYRFSETQLKQYGISFGISMPLLSSNSSSSMSLGFEFGKMGTTENGLIEDNYLKFNLGFSLSPNAKFDRWFWKRLYD